MLNPITPHESADAFVRRRLATLLSPCRELAERVESVCNDIAGNVSDDVLPRDVSVEALQSVCVELMTAAEAPTLELYRERIESARAAMALAVSSYACCCNVSSEDELQTLSAELARLAK